MIFKKNMIFRKNMIFKKNMISTYWLQVASCTYYQYGAGGRQDSLNALCILALNIIIDKVYLIIWFWYIFIISAGSLRLVQRYQF